MTRARSILIAALGGQGGGVLAEWLVDAAARAGFPAQATSIPGVAQRTGATTYYVEIYPQSINDLGGRKPILGLYPVPGGVDLLIASELLEAARMVQAGMVSSNETLLIASTSRTLTTIEKMALTDGRVDSGRLLEVVRSPARRLVTFDMDAAARESGTVVSAVMAGAIAGSGILPFAADEVGAAIRSSGVGVESSLRGFERGRAALTDSSPSLPPFDYAQGRLPRESGAVGRETLGPRLRRDDNGFPPAIGDLVALGTARVREFQDDAYADLYLRRLSRIFAAERVVDGDATHGYALTRETARFLALWMAFDDIVRVAALKCRASRFARVRREVAARPGDIVRIVDYFKPGVPEIAGLLPPTSAQRLVAWNIRRQQRGERPWARSIRLRADGVFGFLALRVLASLKRFRRRGARYRDEQALIGRWLTAIESAARTDWRTAYEIALCGCLIKGYGATNERGKNNFVHILDHVSNGVFMTASLHAEAIRKAREAALADEGGTALSATLVELGAPPPPPVTRPVMLVRRKRTRDRIAPD
jgi:indolepyruvate ferredoxin oxidoreductase beta subunit